MYYYISDYQTWRDFKRGDEEAYIFLYRQYTPVLFKYGMKIAPDRNRELVKDAIQDLFVYLWRSREKLSDTTSIKFYLFAALKRIIFPKQKLNAQCFDETLLESDALGFDASPEEYLIETQTSTYNSQKLSREVDQLPERQKEAVFLRFYANMEFCDVAKLMGITPRAVYKLIYKAIEAMQKNLLAKMLLLLGIEKLF